MYTYKTRLFCKNYEGASDTAMSLAVRQASHAAFDYIEECVGFRDHELDDVLSGLTQGKVGLAVGLMERASKMAAHFYVLEQHEHGHFARMTQAEFLRVKEKLHENARVVGLEWEMLQYNLRLEPWFFGEHHWCLTIGSDCCFGNTLTDLRYNYGSLLITELLDEIAEEDD